MAGPATGHDVPTELFDIVVAFIPVNETEVWSSEWPPAHRRRHSITLVCLRWAQIYRRKLWDGSSVRIASWEHAQWFKWIATNRGSNRLTPVIDLIGYVDVVQNVEAPRSWLHLLYYKSSRAKLRNLQFIGTPKGLISHGLLNSPPLDHSTPHWGISKPLPPSLTPYKQVRLTDVSLPSPLTNLARLLSYFRHATEVWLDHVAYTGEPTDMVAVPQRHHPIAVRLVWGTLQWGILPDLRPGFPGLMMAIVARGRECPLMRSSELEQLHVRCIITDISQHVGQDNFGIQCRDGELVIRMKSDLISLRYGPSPMGPEEKTLTHVSLSMQYTGSSEWYSTLSTILAQLPSLQGLVVNLDDLFQLEMFLAEPAIQSLARQPAISVHATYPQLEKQPHAQPKGYVQVDPITLRPTGKLLSPREISALFQVEDSREGGTPEDSSGRANSLDDILPGLDLFRDPFRARFERPSVRTVL